MKENEKYIQPMCLCGEELQLLQEVTSFEAYNLDKEGVPFPGALVNEELAVNWQILLCVKCNLKFEAIIEEVVKKKVFGKDKKIERFLRGKLVKPKKRFKLLR